MWINLSKDDVSQILSALFDQAHQYPDKMESNRTLFKRLEEDLVDRLDPENQPVMDAATNAYADDAVVSETDNGAWVMAWVYVEGDEAEEDDTDE